MSTLIFIESKKMFQGNDIKEVTTSTKHSVWLKKCIFCKRIKLIKHFSWYPMKANDSCPKIMDACTKCAKKMKFRIFDAKDFKPDFAFLNKLKYIDMHLNSTSIDEQHDDRHSFNLGNGSRWIKAKSV